MSIIHKFRIWSNLLNVYVTDLSLENLEVTNVHTLNDLFENKYLVYQEFIGLYDKNGKEVFEGDILLYEMNHAESVLGGENTIGLVNYTHGHYYFQDDEYDEPIHEFCVGQTETLDLKIIGNINQNKELLK